ELERKNNKTFGGNQLNIKYQHGIDSTKKTKDTLTAYHSAGTKPTYYDDIDSGKTKKNTY
uniref:Opacity protein (Clone 9) (Fragments) n=1 Tax=Neisseria gonorrhoeae TaxID=485 RepID=Q7M0T2_NEIGO